MWPIWVLSARVASALWQCQEKLEPDWRGKIITSLRHKRHRQVQARRWRCGIALSATETAYDSAQRELKCSEAIDTRHHTPTNYLTNLEFGSYP